jgi:hypothetical protein
MGLQLVIYRSASGWGQLSQICSFDKSTARPRVLQIRTAGQLSGQTPLTARAGQFYS